MNNEALPSAKSERKLQKAHSTAYRGGAMPVVGGEGITAPIRGDVLITPTRSPVRHACRNFRGKYPSSKNAQHVKFESYLAVLVARLLEFLRNALGYSEQPPALHFRVGRRRRRKLTPDFIVHRRIGRDSALASKHPLNELARRAVAGREVHMD